MRIETTDVLSEESLVRLRHTRWLGNTVYYYEEIDSTNTQAKRLSREGAPNGTVVAADVQTQGRGRRGRQWITPGGRNLAFSILLRPEFPTDKASMVTLVAAMAVVKAISQIPGLSPVIKWPNDVVLGGRKVCGILTELSVQDGQIENVIVGIGINVKRQDFPAELAETATSLEEQGGRVGRAELLESVLEQFEIYYDKYLETLDVSLFRQEYEEFLANKDQQVQVLDPAGNYTGTARGINDKGELLVECDRGIVTVNSGEVSVRGIYGYI
jgi:BirA family biotin operon repressor/biotin-[acetyl-CoA-carboxylase] ligase